jgi:predicted phage baseplate assembly protein
VRARPAPDPTAGDPRHPARRALEVPGTRVARVRAWTNTHPDYPCLVAPGSVTIVIVPDVPVARPEPSAGLLEVVRRYLDRRRMVTTRLHVIGPRYLEVSVSARVRPHTGTSAAALRPRIVKALDAWLDPRSGGPDGRGWPFGRDVYRSEILQLIDAVPGVNHVLDLSLSAPGLAPQCGNLAVCPSWLAAPGAHRIEVA